MTNAPTLLWLRRDLRLTDHPALCAAVARGGPVIPVFIRDELVDGLGTAPAWRLGLGLEVLARALEGVGSRLILRSGDALAVLQGLIAETGAQAVMWSRCYDPAFIERDVVVKKTLKGQGVAAQSYSGQLLFEPQTVETKTGGFYRVYTPFWNAVRGRSAPVPLAAPSQVPGPQVWPGSEALSDWRLGAGMRRGADIVRPHLLLGEAAAQERLVEFVDGPIAQYKARRDFPAEAATSGLSEPLALGEISPAQVWHAGWRAMQEGAAGAETFLKEVVWREFAYHLAYHTPHMLTRNWRQEWDAFPWQTDPEHPHVLAWKQGRTGIRFVDAAMREMYVTGRMHNRARMIVGSYLTKHLLTDWRIGQAWFADCLTDWDPAANAMGWQWVAGSGPDAAPYFRVFNPVTQLEKFDPKGQYTRRWLAEGQVNPPQTALDWFRAVPESWGLTAQDRYPAPIVSAEDGRKRALHAYENRGF